MTATIAEKLKAAKLWFMLTESQQAFLLHYMESKDATAAAHASFKCKDDKSADTIAGRTLRNWKVQRVLSEVGGIDIKNTLVSKPEAMQLISDKLRASSTDAPAFVKLLQAYMDLNGWQEAAPKKEKPVTDINQAVREIEQQKRNANG